jgi:hypothetical protein
VLLGPSVSPFRRKGTLARGEVVTFKGDVGEDDFVVCFGVFFAGDPLYDWGNGTLWFCWVGAHFGDGEEWEVGGLYVFTVDPGEVWLDLAGSAIGATQGSPQGGSMA